MAERASPRQISAESVFSPGTSTSNSVSLGQSSVGALSSFNEKTSSTDKHSSKYQYDPEEFVIRKRLPPSLPKRSSDIYVTNKTHFKVQLNRCERLIDDGIAVLEDTTGSKNKEATIEKQALVYLHSLGAAIPRALNLALQLQRRYGSRIQLDTTTSTVELTDDFEPIIFDAGNSTGKETITRSRYNSAVHVKISRRNTIASPGSDPENANSTITSQEQ